MNETINRVAVAGLGTAGGELARELAIAGVEVVGIDPDPERGARLLRDTAANPASTGRVTVHTTAAAAAGCAVVVEAVPEEPAVKRQVLAELAGVCGPDAIAVVTSVVLPVTEVVDGTGWAGRACGLHYLGPLADRKLVELAADGEVARQRAGELCAVLGRRVRPRERPDVIGVVPALVLRVLNAAALLHEHRYADAAQIDTALRLGCGWRWGPLALLDAIGLDVALAALDQLAERTGRDEFVAAPVLRRLVSAGRLGDKTGAGFHDRTATASPAEPDRCAADSRVPIRTAGVLGSGTMATGVAAALAAAGIPVTLVARTPTRAAAAVESAAEQAGPHAATITGACRVAALSGCDVVIEAVAEDLEVKRRLLAEADRCCPAATLLATTTSSLAVIDCATATTRPERVAGLHFFNPAPTMPLVELVTTELTAPAAERTARALCRRLGKEAVTSPDRAGFLVNRVLFPMLNDAVAAVADGRTGADTLDAVLRSGLGLPTGPIRLLDAVGADVALSVMESLRREFGGCGLTPAPALRALVADGQLGWKVGRSVRQHPALRPAQAS